MKSFIQILVSRKMKKTFTLAEIKHSFNIYLEQQYEVKRESDFDLTTGRKFKKMRPAIVMNEKDELFGLEVYTSGNMNSSGLVAVYYNNKKHYIHNKFLKY